MPSLGFTGAHFPNTCSLVAILFLPFFLLHSRKLLSRKPVGSHSYCISGLVPYLLRGPFVIVLRKDMQTVPFITSTASLE